LFQTVSGKEGSIKIVELGAVIGQFSSWRLSKERKKDREDEFTELYTFQGECQYINPSLFYDEDYSPQVFLVVQRNRRTKKEEQFRLDQEPGKTRKLDGRSLLMEGCRLASE